MRMAPEVLKTGNAGICTFDPSAAAVAEGMDMICGGKEEILMEKELECVHSPIGTGHDKHMAMEFFGNRFKSGRFQFTPATSGPGPSPFI